MTTTPADVAARSTAGLEELGRTRLLRITDRCDRCGAQAYIRATLRTQSADAATGGQLFFCAHHGREHETALRPQSSHWLDESRFINLRPTNPDA